MPCRTFPTSRRAFTLTELLIVVTIIGILAGLAFPIFSIVRNNAKKLTCTNRQRQIHIAMMVYVEQNRGRFPPHCHWDQVNQTFDSSWYTLVTADWERPVGIGSASATPDADYKKQFFCSEDNNHNTVSWRDIEVNWLFSIGYSGSRVAGMDGNPGTTRRSSIVNPGKTILFGDSFWVAATSISGAKLPGYHVIQGNYAPGQTGAAGIAYPRHLSGTACVITWVDGSSSFIKTTSPGNAASLYRDTTLGGLGSTLVGNSDDPNNSYWDLN